MRFSLPDLVGRALDGRDASALLADLPDATMWLSLAIGARCTWWTDGELGVVSAVSFARLDELPLEADETVVARLRARLEYWLVD